MLCRVQIVRSAATAEAYEEDAVLVMRLDDPSCESPFHLSGEAADIWNRLVPAGRNARAGSGLREVWVDRRELEVLQTLNDLRLIDLRVEP